MVHNGLADRLKELHRGDIEVGVEVTFNFVFIMTSVDCLYHMLMTPR